jgi:glucose dehydrogenase
MSLADRTSRLRQHGAVLLVVMLPTFLPAGAPARQGTKQKPSSSPYSTWSDYGGGADSMQYSALEAINKSNVN